MLDIGPDARALLAVKLFFIYESKKRFENSLKVHTSWFNLTRKVEIIYPFPRTYTESFLWPSSFSSKKMNNLHLSDFDNLFGRLNNRYNL